jgi:putative ABC transport system permease protein
MKLPAKLAYSQLNTNKSRTVWTLLGIALSAAMITAVFGFAASGDAMMKDLMGGRDYYERMYYATLYGVGAVFSTIIISASVVVVSNAFRVSAGERMRQFGILKSAGATKKQITQIIMHEGVFLSVVGIPAGIALGLIVHFIGILITDYYFAALNRMNETQIVMKFVLAWHAILISIVLSSVTVYLSAWLPARKAARISAIDAIRGAGEVNVKAKQLRGGRIIRMLFGFEGTLASKSLKRSKRNFRATVVSLTVSSVLFIVVGSFGSLMEITTGIFYPEMNVTAVCEFLSSRESVYGDDGSIVEYNFAAFDSMLGSKLTEQLREYPGATVFGVGSERNLYGAYVPKDMLTEKMYQHIHASEGFSDSFLAIQNKNLDHSLRSKLSSYDEELISLPTTLVVLDAYNYELLCVLADVPIGSNILVNHYRGWDDGGGITIFVPYVFNGQTLKFSSYYTDEEFELTLHGALTVQDLPAEVQYAGAGDVSVIVPQLEVPIYSWIADVSNTKGFLEYAEDVLYGAVSLNESSQLHFMDVAAAEEASANVGQLVMVFVYGFIALLTLIGLTNVISTISANIRSRSQEFAVLQSVGMTQAGLYRMLTLESILCSVKSLIIGVPLGIIGSMITYGAMVVPAEFSYTIPWIPVLQCILGIFLITWIVTRYSASQLRGRSIVETIRAKS